MPSVKIYFGTAEILATIQADLEVSSIAEYVPAYDRIVRSLHNGQQLVVKVTNLTVGSWLNLLESRYGSERIQIERVNYRDRLHQLWGIEIPEDYRDDQLAQAHLLDIEITPPPGRTFDDFVLEIFFSPWLAQPRLPLQRIGELIKTINPEQWDKASKRPLIGDILSKRLSLWEQNTQKVGEKLIIRWLGQSPEQLMKKLAIYKVLENYPSEVGQRAFGDEFGALQELDIDLRSIQVNETTINPVLDHIKVYLEHLTRGKDKQKSLDQLLKQVSGCLELEFEVALRFVHTAEVAVDQELVRRIRSTFTPLQSRPNLDQAMADLDLLVRKPEPPEPNPDPDNPWTDDEWLEWAERNYLPYRFWLEEIGELSGNVVKYASAYADWLFQRYPSIRLNSPKIIYQALPYLKERMMGSSPVLVIVIDNFNAKFAGDLIRYMQSEGYYAEKLNYYFSMLPSCTEVSKKCLILGQPEPFTGTVYENIVETTWEKALTGRRVRYLPHIGALRAVKNREHDIFFLNYMPLDIAFHQDEEQTGISHAQAARNYLRGVSKDVKAFAERIGAERELIVIVLSDHGSTRIPADAPNIIDSKFFATRVIDKHHRYVSINDSELSQLPDLSYQCYTFERGRFGLDGNYLAAREYYHFLKTSENIYIHGGLTPEETLIPVVVFTPLTVSAKPILVRLLNNEFYIERKSEIQVELVNTNTYSCQNLKINILNPGINVTSVQVPTLEALSQYMVKFEGRFRRGFGKAEKLHLRLSYLFLGQPQGQEIELEVKMKSMMEQAFDLNELH